MVSGTLLIASGAALIVAGVYGLVGARLLARRPPTVDGRRAMTFFAVWWFALAVNLALAGIMYATAALGYVNLDVQTAYAIVQRLLLSVSLFGLMSYLIYVLTGQHRIALVGTYYGLFFVLILYTMVSAGPNGVFVGTWRTDLNFANPTGVLRLVNFVTLVFPPVVGALAYFRLYFTVSDPSKRWRIALVSWSLIVWWIVSVVAGQRQSIANDSFQIVNRFISLAAALVILAAYYPPAFVRRRWGVQAAAA